MDMNKKDKENIEKIESLRLRLLKNESGRGGLVLYVDARAVEFSIERDKKFEQIQARFIDFQFNDVRRQLEPAFFDIAKIVSDYLTSADVYTIIRAGVQSYVERGF